MALLYLQQTNFTQTGEALDEITKELTSWVRLEDITPDDWERIREHAEHFISTGQYNDDPIKCTVAAFMVVMNTEIVFVEPPEGEPH